MAQFCLRRRSSVVFKYKLPLLFVCHSCESSDRKKLSTMEVVGFGFTNSPSGFWLNKRKNYNHRRLRSLLSATSTNGGAHKFHTPKRSDIANTNCLMKVSSDSLHYESGFLGVPPEKLAVEPTQEEDCFPCAVPYLRKILSAKVYDVAVESPLELASRLSGKLGVRLWLKREDLQPIFSFKLRGAYNMMVKLPKEQLGKGVICCSAGNHAQGVALSAQKLGCTAVIAMPITVPEIKRDTVERLGAEVVLVGDSYDEAQAYAKERAIYEGRTFVPGFDHPDVIAGQGTVGMEILRQMPDSLHAIFVPVGGGGLIAGIAAYVKSVCPEVKIIGVEPYDANSMALSLHHRKRITLDPVGEFAEGVAMKVVGEETFRLCQKLVDGIVLVSHGDICTSIKDMFEEKRSILEPAGALAMAGAKAYCKYYELEGENVVAITSGANMNFDRLKLVLKHGDSDRRSQELFQSSGSKELLKIERTRILCSAKKDSSLA